MRLRHALAIVAVLALSAGLQAADDNGLKKGTPDIKSIGALAFSPDGVLFIGDAQGAAIFAVQVTDAKGTPAAVKIEKVDEKVAALLGTSAKDVKINDLAINPVSGKPYLSVSRGQGASAGAALVRVNGGKVEEVALKDVPFAKTTLPSATGGDAITQIAYSKGKLIVAGLSSEKFASRLRTIAFPFKEADKGAGIKIYHGAHGAFETRSPVRTFTLYDIKGEPHLLASYQCTPLVKIPIASLKADAEVEGTTVAELGSGNRPLDMFVYAKDGKDYILVNNTKYGMIKVTTDNIDKITPITSKISGTAGLTYDKVASLNGVTQMAQLDKGHVVVLKTEAGVTNLETAPLP